MSTQGRGAEGERERERERETERYRQAQTGRGRQEQGETTKLGDQDREGAGVKLLCPATVVKTKPCRSPWRGHSHPQRRSLGTGDDTQGPLLSLLSEGSSQKPKRELVAPPGGD